MAFFYNCRLVPVGIRNQVIHQNLFISKFYSWHIYQLENYLMKSCGHFVEEPHPLIDWIDMRLSSLFLTLKEYCIIVRVILLIFKVNQNSNSSYVFHFAWACFLSKSKSKLFIRLAPDNIFCSIKEILNLRCTPYVVLNCLWDCVCFMQSFTVGMAHITWHQKDTFVRICVFKVAFPISFKAC